MNLSELTEKNQMIVGAIKNALKTVVPNNAMGYIALEVSSVSQHLLHKDGPKRIINFKAVTEYNAGLVVQALTSKPLADFSEEDLQVIANKTVSYSYPLAWESTERTPYMPTKGEIVKCKFEQIELSNGVIAPCVQAIASLPLTRTKSISFDDILAGKVNPFATDTVAPELTEAELLANRTI